MLNLLSLSKVVFYLNIGSKIYHPNLKFTINDIEVVITFFDLNTIDVDTLIIPYVAANQDNKTVKRLSRFLSTNISDVRN